MTTASLEKRIAAAVGALGEPLPEGAAAKLATLLTELERWNRKFNLTAIRDPGEMISAHLADSLAARPLLSGTRILDVGTGAGFPGLPLAVVETERRFDLLDSNSKKLMFVEHVARLLDLGNVKAIRARAEDYAPGQGFDTVIARAVASVRRLLEIAGHHVGEDGVFVALKGRYPADELERVPRSWGYEVTELNVPGQRGGSRHAVVLRRSGRPA